VTICCKQATASSPPAAPAGGPSGAAETATSYLVPDPMMRLASAASRIRRLPQCQNPPASTRTDPDWSASPLAAAAVADTALARRHTCTPAPEDRSRPTWSVLVSRLLSPPFGFRAPPYAQRAPGTRPRTEERSPGGPSGTQPQRCDILLSLPMSDTQHDLGPGRASSGARLRCSTRERPEVSAHRRQGAPADGTGGRSRRSAANGNLLQGHGYDARPPGAGTFAGSQMSPTEVRIGNDERWDWKGEMLPKPFPAGGSAPSTRSAVLLMHPAADDYRYDCLCPLLKSRSFERNIRRAFASFLLYRRFPLPNLQRE
jgi:hypothetical protein